MRGPTTTGWRRERPEFPISSSSAGAGDFGATFRLILLTNDPALAAAADPCVQRIGIDFEHIGKAERQAGYDTRVSRHEWSELAAIARVLKQARAFARLNPAHDGTEAEIERALSCGAQVLMLPFFRGREEVERFVGLVRRRAEVMCLIETASSFVRIREILSVRGVDELMIGLNDLRLQLGVANHFEVLASPIMDGVCAAMRRGRPAVQLGRRRASGRCRHAGPERPGLCAVSAARRDGRPADACLREGPAAGRSAACGGDPAAAPVGLGMRGRRCVGNRARRTRASRHRLAQGEHGADGAKPRDVRPGRRASGA